MQLFFMNKKSTIYNHRVKSMMQAFVPGKKENNSSHVNFNEENRTQNEKKPAMKTLVHMFF